LQQTYLPAYIQGGSSLEIKAGGQMLLILGLLLSFLHQQRNAPNELAGTWLNQDPSTMGITQILIADQDGVLRVRVWGACVPSDCDWGATELHFTDGWATSLFDMGQIATKMYFVRLPNDKLLAVSKSQFNDGSNRSEPDRAEIFVREEQSDDAASISAKNLLKKVAETYRTLPTAQFEFEEVSDHVDEVTVTRVKTQFSQPNKLRVEVSGSGESSVMISDGHTAWTFFPESNEYTTRPTGEEHSSVNAYDSLDEIVGSRSISGSERVGDVDCTVVMIKRPNQTRTLWIDPKTNFIRKDQVTSVSPTTGAVQRSLTTSFSEARIVTDLDDRLFSFDPQKTQAKSRLALQREALVKSVGTPAPDFSLSNLEGKEVKLSQFKGKVVLLNFWASWCVPCRSEMPAIELLHREFKDKGLIVLGIDEEESQKQATFLQKFGFSFASLVEPKKQVSNLYSIGGIPTTVLIDQQGRIKAYDQGSASYESLRKTLHEMGIL
jgi:cytochrome c biogenesis protein CcmG/thiol:disulfide interchange protein DsbE